MRKSLIPSFVLEKAKDFNEKIYVSFLRVRNKNKTPTIVCNNCIGGIIYHNLGLAFQSPTINLFFPTGDYVEFAKHFAYYSTCNIEQVNLPDVHYPVGKIIPKDDQHKPILVHFQHYDSFALAKRKWIERYKRVDWDNVFYIMEFYHTRYDYSIMKTFDELPLQHKIILTHQKFDDIRHQFPLSCYTDDNPVAKILEYKGYSGKRYLDEFDYVRFLNER